LALLGIQQSKRRAMAQAAAALAGSLLFVAASGVLLTSEFRRSHAGAVVRLDATLARHAFDADPGSAS
jgi:hypothetical protein